MFAALLVVAPALTEVAQTAESEAMRGPSI